MHAGKQGLVVMVADARLTLFSPHTGEQYDVLVRDTRDAAHLDTPVPYADLKMERPQALLPGSLNQPASLAASAFPSSMPSAFASAAPLVPSAPQMYRKRRDPLVGKAVVVISGPHKGHMGIVKDVQDTKLEVELHANSSLVLLKRQHLQLKDGARLDLALDDDARKSDPEYSLKSSFFGGATPFLGGTTPFVGGKTPFLGGATPARAFLPGSHTPFLGSGAKTPFMLGAKTPYMAGTRTPFTGAYGPLATNTWGGATTPAAASMMMHPGHPSFRPTSANFPPPRSPGSLYPPRSPGFGGSRSPGFGARTPTAFALKEPGTASASFGPPGASFGPPGTIFGQPPSYGPPGSFPSYGLAAQPPSFGPPGQASYGFPHSVPPPLAPWDRLGSNTGLMIGHRTPTTAPTMRTPASAILQAGAKTPGAN
jgi:KOW motif